nr:DUF6527 family protein [uncultured Sphingobacterium sp.]
MLRHKFVEFIPQVVEEGVLYVSIEYCTAIHMCICGCGNKVVTPLSPTDWKLTFNGKAVTLHPSIGNWNFKCQSHYWIINNKIEFASSWNKREIRKGRERDIERKKEYFEVKDIPTEKPRISKGVKPTFWYKVLKGLGL